MSPELVTPIFEEDLEAVRARVIADANAGLSPEDDSYIDTVEGGFWWDHIMAMVLEIERLYDFLAVEVPSVMFIQTAYGEYLDDFGEMLDVERKPAAQATGEVTFSGADDIDISVGTRVGVEAPDPDSEEIEFETTESGTISGATPSVTLEVRAVETGTAGNVGSGAIMLLLTPIGSVTVTNAEPITGGADPETDEAYAARLLLEFPAAQGAGTVDDYERWTLAYPGVGFVTVEPLWDGNGTVRVVATDTENDPLSGAVVLALQTQLDPPVAATELRTASQNMADATIEVDDTTDFRTSGKFHWNGQSITYTGKTADTFTGCTGGSGTGLVDEAVTQGGAGSGQAPIGADVFVATPTALAVDISATVTHEDGYSLDGALGTVATEEEIIERLGDYINSRNPGDDVILSEVAAQIVLAPGVYDVASVQINGVAANLSVSGLQVPFLDDVTLT